MSLEPLNDRLGGTSAVIADTGEAHGVFDAGGQVGEAGTEVLVAHSLRRAVGLGYAENGDFRAIDIAPPAKQARG